MSYDVNKTLGKGFWAFIAGGVAALIPFVQGISEPELLIYVPIAVAVLVMVQNFVKHFNDV